MRNLFSFLIRHHVFLLFLVMELIALQMLVQTQAYHHSRFSSSAHNLSGGILKSFQNTKNYLSLKKINDILSEENKSLKNKNSVLLKRKNNPSSFTPSHKYISAKVIKNSFNKRNNYLTINKGSIGGIKNGMGVCSAIGVVGIVRDVSPHYSTVMSLLNKKSSISTRFSNSNHFGELLWNGRSYEFAQLHSIEKYVPVSAGDSLVTNSFSNIFPDGIPIGSVNRFERNESENFYSIEVDLHVDFSDINYVYIIDNPQKFERQGLEKKYE